MTKSLVLTASIAVILVLGCNTAEKRGERADAAASRLHTG